ncbi:MAG: hypothetical protein JO150_14070 [Acidobacteriaceae bacterium]|nr:hypothetical protein [Acidobacteriaceae bacterium]
MTQQAFDHTSQLFDTIRRIERIGTAENQPAFPEGDERAIREMGGKGVSGRLEFIR